MMLRTLENVVRSSWGTLVEAERSLGTSPNFFSNVFNLFRPLGFWHYIVICARTGVEPVGVLRGNAQASEAAPESNCMAYEVHLRMQRGAIRRRVKSDTEVDSMLRAILASSPDIHLDQLVKKIGTSATRLKRLYPDLTREMLERRRNDVRRRKWLYLLAFGRKLRLLKAQLNAEGLVFNRGNIFRRTRIIIRSTSGSKERLFQWLQQRELKR
jgi:hypothetical protein